MTMVKVTCEQCGDLELNPSDITARLCADTEEAQYRFRCPVCEFTTVKDIAHRLLNRLEAAGTTVDVWRLPRELSEPRTGPDLTHVDLVEFHEAISDESSFEQELEKLAF